MCFSATVSISASIVLAGIGCATLRKVHTKEGFLLGSIPLLFAFQQLSEGVVWFTLNMPAFFWVHIIATYIFLLFAFGTWPVIFPLAIYFIETQLWRKRLLLAISIIGIILSTLLLFSLYTNGVNTSEYNGNLLYSCKILYVPNYLYLFVISGAFLLSSNKNIQIFGVLTFISFWIADIFYRTTFTSVWCFFAAILSAWLYFAIPKMKLQKK